MKASFSGMTYQNTVTLKYGKAARQHANGARCAQARSRRVVFTGFRRAARAQAGGLSSVHGRQKFDVTPIIFTTA